MRPPPAHGPEQPADPARQLQRLSWKDVSVVDRSTDVATAAMSKSHWIVPARPAEICLPRSHAIDRDGRDSPITGYVKSCESNAAVGLSHPSDRIW
jgi:hypothetical protein